MPTLANRNNNPGNLRFIGQQGASQGEGGFAKFNSPEEGYAALLNDVEAKLTGKSRSGLKPTDTLVDFTKVYAPASDNNAPGSYAAAVANKLGISPATTLQELQPRIAELAEAIAHHEGYQGATSASGGYNPKPFSSPTGQGYSFTQPGYTPPQQEQPQEQGLGEQLIGRTNEAGQAIKKTMTGEINPISGVIQTAGAVAGGFGDIIGKGLELIPGVKQVENLIGKGIGSLAKTPVGQSVMQNIQQFSQDHPELAADIGAGVNIITAIPILKGLGAIKNVAMDSVANSLKNIAVKGVTEDVAGLMTNKTGQRFLAQGGKDLIEKGAQEGIFPDIVNQGGTLVYDGTNATKLINSKIDAIYEDLIPKIKNATQGKVANMIPISALEKEAKAVATEKLIPEKPLLKEIELLRKKYGDYLSIDQVNEAKQIVAQSISDAQFGNPKLSTDKIIREIYQKTVEDMGEKLGIPEIHEQNQLSRKLYKLLDVYEPGGFIHGKPIKPLSKEGLLMKLAKGTPGISGLANYATENLSPRELRKSILRRSAPGYKKTTGKQALKKTGLMMGAVEANKLKK